MIDKKILSIVKIVKKIVRNKSNNLHEPLFDGNEVKYLKECIKSTYVSSVGRFVNLFEKKLAKFTKSKYAIAVINGTSALHILLKSIGVDKDDEVLVPSLTFVSTANAVTYCGAKPNFVDVEENSFGICATKLRQYLEKNSLKKREYCINKKTGKKIKALIAVHLLGFPCDIYEILKVCKEYNIKVIEDAAEALGSFYKKKHLGTFSIAGMISFNGNKTLTTGNGAVIITKNKKLAKKLKHISTTAKVKHDWECIHDEIGYNYRLSNINAAIGCAQIENLKNILNAKKKNYQVYLNYFKKFKDVEIKKEPRNGSINHWLISLIIKNNKIKKNTLLRCFYKFNIKCRPFWKPLHTLKIFKDCQKDNCNNSSKIYKTTISLPSSPELNY